MLYEYRCVICEETFTLDFKMGCAPKEAECPECKKPSPRYYGGVGFVLKGGGWPSKTGRTKAQGLANNEAASKRMHKNRSAPKLKALDYGGGNVKEV